MVELQRHTGSTLYSRQMKIVGLTYFEGKFHFTMKCDSSLLNQDKPFFLPEWTTDLRQVPCYVARICRLGKWIAPKYASRYYDATAFGIDFVAMDFVAQDYARATAFDSALAVGKWGVKAASQTLDEAISEVSKVVTLRMGDLVYVDFPQEPEKIEREQILEQEGLFCRIK